MNLQILKKKSYSYVQSKANFMLSESVLSSQTFCVCYNKSLLCKRDRQCWGKCKNHAIEIVLFFATLWNIPYIKWKTVSVNKNCKETIVL